MPGDFLKDIQLASSDVLGYTDAQVDEIGKYLASAINDPTINPFLADELPKYMQEKFGSDFEYDEDYFIKIGPDAIAGDLKDAYKDVQMEITDKYDAETARELLGPNALSDDVLNIINSDLDPDMSVAEAESWSALSNSPDNYDPIVTDLSEKEKYDIAFQNGFDQKEYNDHIKWLDTQDIKQINDRASRLVSGRT